jgi:uncharacterized protein (TIGR03435 family)
MKRHDENLRDVFDRHMPPAAPGALEDAAARVLQRLREGRHYEAVREQPAVSRLRYRPRFAVAATVLIAMVGVGLYAAQLSNFLPAIFSFQRVSSSQVARQFAAASVRPVEINPELINVGFRCLGVDGLLGKAAGVQDPKARRGRCSGIVNLGDLVYDAYAVSRVSGPKWGRMAGSSGLSGSGFQWSASYFRSGSYFQIEAVADDPERVTKDELKLMLQTLLEDRFKARVHLEARDLDGYVLTVAKTGAKFKETSGEATGCSTNGNIKPPGLYGKCEVARVVTFLTLNLGAAPVVDKTGLTGLYDINLILEEIQDVGAGAGTRGGGGGAPQPRQFTTPLPKALEEQLGLHLERAKVPAEFVVVDHLELPTEN